MASLRNRLCPARSSRVQSGLHCVTHCTVSPCPVQKIALHSLQNLETSLTPSRLLGRRVAGGRSSPPPPLRSLCVNTWSLTHRCSGCGTQRRWGLAGQRRLLRSCCPVPLPAPALLPDAEKQQVASRFCHHGQSHSSHCDAPFPQGAEIKPFLP